MYEDDRWYADDVVNDDDDAKDDFNDYIQLKHTNRGS